jgi:hypothetical protein
MNADSTLTKTKARKPLDLGSQTHVASGARSLIDRTSDSGTGPVG